jgi:hypothetical protein
VTIGAASDTIVHIAGIGIAQPVAHCDFSRTRQRGGRRRRMIEHAPFDVWMVRKREKSGFDFELMALDLVIKGQPSPPHRHHERYR